MSEARGSEPQSSPSDRVESGRTAGYYSRSARRSARRSVRRRRTLGRLYRYAVPGVVVIAAAVVLLVLLGGPESDTRAVAPPSTESTELGRSSTLLVIARADAVRTLVWFLPGKQDGVALGIPGSTLVKTPAGFKTVADLLASRQDDALADALTEMLGIGIRGVASVQWAQLAAELDSLGQAYLQEEASGTDADAATAAVEAIMDLLGRSGQDGAAAMERVGLEGEKTAFLASVNAMAPSLSSGNWSRVVLPGKMVQGADFAYYEPDVERAKALLAGEEAGPAVTLEVQNGSGALGAAEAAARLLGWPGYDQSPVRNSPDFPGVRHTRIAAAPDVLREAERARARLGVGTIEVDNDLDPGHMVVVVGEDFIAPSVTSRLAAD